MLTTENKNKIWKLIEPIKIAMLITQDDEALRARPMYHVNSDFEGELYYFTNVVSDKIMEVLEHSHVGLSYCDHKTNTYVSLCGKGEVTRDKDLINKYWNPFVSAWFPEGKDSPNIGLLKVTISEAEYWDGPSSKMVQLFKLATAKITQRVPDMGKHEQLS